MDFKPLLLKLYVLLDWKKSKLYTTLVSTLLPPA